MTRPVGVINWVPGSRSQVPGGQTHPTSPRAPNGQVWLKRLPRLVARDLATPPGVSHHPTPNGLAQLRSDCEDPSFRLRGPFLGHSRFLQSQDLTEPPREAGGKATLCTLGIVVLRHLMLRLKQVTYFLCALHLPAYFAKAWPANYACPVKGTGRGSENHGKVSDAHARCGRWSPPPPPTA